MLGGAPDGVFSQFSALGDGDIVPGEWWRVTDGEQTVGYGWMDVTWGDAEILLAVDPAVRGQGVGSFILDHLEQEAAQQGLRYMLNVIPTAHPDPEGLAAWLRERGFVPSGADGTLLRRAVRSSRAP